MISPYWLTEIYDLVQKKEFDSALDIIWRQFDKFFRDVEFQKANDVLPEWCAEGPHINVRDECAVTKYFRQNISIF